MAPVVGPMVVAAAARAATAVLTRALDPSATRGTREEWAEALGELQHAVTVATAVQDLAIARLAAVEPECAEDGTVLEVHRAPGHVSLDASSIVSGVLLTSAAGAERRVRSAVRMAADGPEGTEAATGLGGLHRAMAEGRLDAYRAGVVADELELAPPEVAAGVVAALEPYLDREDGPRLRRRCRRVLARVSPDLLRQRAERARSESRLERWASEPGVDTWHGTFPSEEAARAWAAVDALAQRYVADGVCEDVGRARAKALTDLVEGSATVETVVSLVVPEGAVDAAGGRRDASGEVNASGGAGTASRADGACRGDEAAPCVAAPPATATDDLVEVAGLRAGEPVLVGRGWLLAAVAATRVQGRDRLARGRVVADPRTGALTDPSAELSTDAYRPGPRLASHVRSRDGRCRFPGCHVAARFCDLDHARPWPSGPTSADNLLCLCRRHHRIKQRPGWRLRLDPDATAHWTDPTGAVRRTDPVDAMHTVVLSAAARPHGPGACGAPRGTPRTVLPDGPHSALEHRLEHRLAEVRRRRCRTSGTSPPRSRGEPDPPPGSAGSARLVGPPPF